MQAVFFAQSHDLFPGFLLLQKAELVRLHAHDDVVEHREALHQLEVLVHHADAQIVGVVGVVDGHDLAVLADLPLLRLVQAEQNAHQRGFARAVFAQQGVDLTAAQLQGDVVIGDDARESLRYMEHLNDIWIVQANGPPLRYVSFIIL